MTTNPHPFLPAFTAIIEPDGSITLRIKPPAWTRAKEKTLPFTSAQYSRFLRWQAGEGLIQTMFPDLTPSQRELLLTGLNDSEFHAAVGSEGKEEND